MRAIKYSQMYIRICLIRKREELLNNFLCIQMLQKSTRSMTFSCQTEEIFTYERLITSASIHVIKDILHSSSEYLLVQRRRL